MGSLYRSWAAMSAACLLTAAAFAQAPGFRASSQEAGIDPVDSVAFFFGQGAAAADYDNDGDVDFYLTTAATEQDRLYQNQGDGTFLNVSESVGLAIEEATRTALWFDYDGDGLLDLLVIGERCQNLSCDRPALLWLFRQTQTGDFEDVTERSGLDFGQKHDGIRVFAIGGVAAGDLNDDGWLDLLVTMWGGEHTLFLNQGDGAFSDATQEARLDNGRRFYWQPLLYDFNGDGWLDVFCNVDFAPNELWLSQGDGTFLEMAGQTGAAAYFNEMGVAFGDFDNDGDFDIYATNISREHAGVAQHNVLLVNETQDGAVSFTESAKLHGIHESGWDWGATFLDVNNDGWLDLATTNGWNDRNWRPDSSRFWLNVNGSFTDYSQESGFDDSYSATTLLAFDYDRDGDQDLLQTLKDGMTTLQPAIVYENQLLRDSTSRYLTVKPRMNGANRFAIGATVRVRGADGFQGARFLTAGTSFYGQEPAEAFFGVKDLDTVEVTVEWPTGEVSTFPEVETNRDVTLNYEVVTPPAEMTAAPEETFMALQWQDRSDNETGFEVQRSESEDFAEQVTFLVEAERTTYEDHSAAPGIHYHYRIKAFNERVHSTFALARVAGVIEIEEEVIIEVTGLEEAEAAAFELSPNPSEGAFLLSLSGPYRGRALVSVTDMNGREAWRGSFLKEAGPHSEALRIDLPPGLYALRVRMGEKEAIGKLLIH